MRIASHTLKSAASFRGRRFFVLASRASAPVSATIGWQDPEFMACSLQYPYAFRPCRVGLTISPKESHMREFKHALAAAFSVACIAGGMTVLSEAPALAQAKEQMPAQAAPQGQPIQLKQIPLTEKQIEGVIAAQKDLDVITDKLPDNARPDAKVIAQLDAAAKKHGFASYDEYANVVDNISLVLGGFDPQTRKYVGAQAVIKSQIAQVQADKKMSDKDKKQALDELNMALKSPELPVENKANIDLVAKYYDKLAAALGEDDN
jgi:hypothetical protein